MKRNNSDGSGKENARIEKLFTSGEDGRVVCLDGYYRQKFIAKKNRAHILGNHGLTITNDQSNERIEQTHVVDYIISMTEELSLMSEKSRLPLIAYLLKLISIEARQTRKQLN